MNDILELLKFGGWTMTIKPDGSWTLANKDEHLSSKDIAELLEFAEFIIHGKGGEPNDS